MKLQHEFEIGRSRDDVWAFFKDIPTVARCLPGAQYEDKDETGKHVGKMLMKVGPFQTAFEGAADVVYDDANNRIDVTGKGVDKKGGSRGKMTMAVQVTEADAATKVHVTTDVQLSGAIAQFGRTGIIEEVADVLIADFVRNADANLSSHTSGSNGAAESHAPESSASAQPSSQALPGFSILMRSLLAWLGAFFKRKEK
ncbi:CoxG family protein [Ferruginivarius sediminum]|uniref:Carbon monoxide dehydrogenase n=1 Tax=Ferruginivarius sediminum TaxID=2661937 RepID=A0A369TCS7_9PROT|nr:SRPBCC family protein [Ferruginivarius sediminum]RDD62195.1 hypothetical protein DRB17_08130 [Ferruginivarius sediminum]